MRCLLTMIFVAISGESANPREVQFYGKKAKV